MRFRHPDGSVVHLAYCTNVHAAEDLSGIVAQLDRFALPVRERLGSAVLGLGLWLAAPVAAALTDDVSLIGRLRGELDARGLEVVTLNGFPYQAFQSEVVKKAVYLPHWGQAERLVYTVQLAEVLHRLLPEGARSGSVSTLPLAWREVSIGDAGVRALEALADQLRRLAERHGRPVRVGIEPEPGCVVERTVQVPTALVDVDHDWIGTCLDACHLAVEFEEADEAVRVLDGAGIDVVKAQLSSALRVPAPAEDRAWARDFVEPRFLHQSRELVDGAVVAVDDLDLALDGGLPGTSEWRVHFHVPVHADGGGRTTQPELRRTIDALVGGPTARTAHLEVETYTWNVLPPEQRPADDAGLVEGIAAELAWVRDELATRGLKELP